MRTTYIPPLSLFKNKPIFINTQNSNEKCVYLHGQDDQFNKAARAARARFKPKNKHSNESQSLFVSNKQANGNFGLSSVHTLKSTEIRVNP